MIPKINWDDKASKNINQILNQLTLRANDSIFVDDNPLEIEKVKSQIKKYYYYKLFLILLKY